MKRLLLLCLMCISTTGLSCEIETVTEFIDDLEELSEIVELRKDKKFQAACKKAIQEKKCLVKKAGDDFMEIATVGAALSMCEANLTNN